MKIEFEKQFGKGVDPWYAKVERWAKKQNMYSRSSDFVTKRLKKTGV